MENQNDNLDSSLESSPTNVDLELVPKTYTSGEKNSNRFFSSRRKKKLYTANAVVLVIVLLIGIASLFLGNSSNAGKTPPKKATDYAVSSLPVTNVKSGQQLQVGEADHLTINGQVIVGNTLVLSPTAAPTNPTAGQIYYDQSTNTPYYYNGSQFLSLGPGQHVSSIGGSTGVVSLGNGLQIIGNQLSLSTTDQQLLSSGQGVTSLQGQTGAVQLSAGAGIGISGTTITNNGVISLTGSGTIMVTQDGNGNYTVSDTTTNGITGSGTTGQIAVFTGSQSLGDSILSQSGSTVIVGGGLNVQGSGGLTLGVAGSTAGSLVLSTTGSGSVTIQSASQSNAVALTIPTDTSSADTICLQSLNNCAAGGAAGGDLTGNYPNPTIAKLQGKTLILSSVPITGAVVQYNGAAFVDGLITNANLQGGDFANIIGTGPLSSGSITTGFGAISTGSNISTTATIYTNSLQQTNVGNNLIIGDSNISNTSSALTFFSHGINFQLPSSGGATQVICTTGISCAQGGGQAVILQPGSAMLDNGTGSSIWINNDGGGNLLQLEGNGSNSFVVSNSGNTTQAGSLTVSSGGIAVTGNSSITGSLSGLTGLTTTGATISGLSTAGIVTNSASGVLGTTSSIGVSNGGTGTTSFTSNGILYGNGTSAIQATNAAANAILATNGSNAPSLTQFLPTAVQGNITGTGTLISGNIATGFGTISTGSSITTTSTVQGGTVIATGALQGNSLSINSGAFSVNSSGAITASTGITSSGAYTQTGSSTNTFSGSTNFTAASGTGLNVTANALVGGTLGVSGAVYTDTLQQTAVGDNLNIGNSNSSDTTSNLTFFSHGINFQLPSSGGATQVICTTGISCTAGGGQAVQLQPGSAMLDNGTGSSIWINNDGGGNLLQLEGNGSNSFVVSNGGNTTQAGSLTVSSGGIAVTGNSSITGSLSGLTGITSSGAYTQTGSSTNTFSGSTNFTAASGTGLNVTANALVGGTLGVSGITTLTGQLNANGGIATNNANLSTGTGTITSGLINGQTIGNNSTFTGTVAIQGSGGLTLGVAGSTAGSLKLANGSTTNLGTLQIATLGQPTTYTLPDPGQATATICLNTGNCAGAGNSITGSGTPGALAKFNGTGTITSSNLSEAGTTLTYGGNTIINATSGFSGNLLNLELNGTSKLSVDQAGNTTQAGSLTVSSGGIAVTGNSSITGSLSGLTGLTTTGATISGLSTAGIVTNSASGVLGTTSSIGVSNGGTGTTSFTSNGILYGNGTSAIQATNAAANAILATNGSNAPSLTQFLPTAVQGNITGTGTLISGNIATGFGTISTGSSITTTSTVQGGTVIATGALQGNSLSINSGAFSVNSSGAITASTGITSSGAYTQTGSSTNTFSGSTNFTAASGTGLNVTANALVGGTLGVSGITTLTGQLNANGGIATNNANLSTGTGTITSGLINGQTIGNNSTFTGTVAIQGSGGLTLGVAGSTAGSLKLANTTNTNLSILQSLAPSGSGSATYTLPSIAGGSSDNVCLFTLGNCATVGSGGTGTTSFTSNGILYGNGTSAIQATNAAANAILATNGSNAPSLTQFLPTAVQGNITGTGTLISGNIATGFGTISTGSSITTTSTVQGGTVIATGALQGNSLSINSGAFSVNSSGAITASTGITSSGAITFSGLGTGLVQATSGLLSTTTNYVASLDTLVGALTLNNSTYSGSAITINNAKADGSTEGIATFNATNFSDNGSGVINTIQSIATTATPTFNTLTLQGAATTDLSLTGTMTPSTTGSLLQLGTVIGSGNTNGTYIGVNEPSTVGHGNQADFINLQVLGLSKFKVDSTGGITSAGSSSLGGNLTVQGSGGLTLGVAGSTAGSLKLANTTNTNLSILQSSAPSGSGSATYTLPSIAGGSSDNVCLFTLGNCAGSGGGITGSGTPGALAKFNGTGTITSSNLSEAGTTLTYGGNTIINATSGFSGNLLNLSVNTTSKLSVDQRGDTLQAGSLTVQSGGIAVTGNSSIGGTLTGLTGVTSSGSVNFTGTLAVTNSGSNSVAITGAPGAITTSSLLQLGNAIVNGNSSTYGGTYLGINEPSVTNAGSTADFLNFQNNGVSELQVTSSGLINASGSLNVGTASNTGTISLVSGLNSGSPNSNTITLQAPTGLTSGINLVLPSNVTNNVTWSNGYCLKLASVSGSTGTLGFANCIAGSPGTPGSAAIYNEDPLNGGPTLQTNAAFYIQSSTYAAGDIIEEGVASGVAANLLQFQNNSGTNTSAFCPTGNELLLNQAANAYCTTGNGTSGTPYALTLGTGSGALAGINFGNYTTLYSSQANYLTLGSGNTGQILQVAANPTANVSGGQLTLQAGAGIGPSANGGNLVLDVATSPASAKNLNFIPNLANANAVTEDGTYIWWGTSTGIGRATLHGSTVQHVIYNYITGLSSIQSIASDGNYIYFTSGNGTISKVSISSGNTALGSPGSGLTQGSNYWANFLCLKNSGASVVNPSTCSGTGGHQVNELAYNYTNSYIYWADKGIGEIGEATNLQSNSAYNAGSNPTGVNVNASWFVTSSLSAPACSGGTEGTGPTAVSVDSTNGYIYWYGNAVACPYIGQALIPAGGSTPTTYTTQWFMVPNDGVLNDIQLATDGTNVYWSNSHKDNIGEVTISNTANYNANLETVGTNNTNGPTGIATSRTPSYLYWTQPSGFSIGRIQVIQSSPNPEVPVLSLSGASGSATFSNGIDNSTALQVQDVNGTSLFNIDTLNNVSSFNGQVLATGGVTTTGLSTPAAPTVISNILSSCGSTTTYTYEITAINATGGSTAASPASTAVSSCYALDSIGDFNAISWTAIPGAYGYNVYRISGGAAGLIYTATQEALSFTDTGSTVISSSTPPTADTSGQLSTTGGGGLLIQDASNAAVFSVSPFNTNNLISSGGFESRGTSSWLVKSTATTPTTTISAVNTQAQQGNYSMQIAASTTANDGASSTTITPLSNSTAYTFSFYAKVASGTMSDLNAGYEVVSTNTSSGAVTTIDTACSLSPSPGTTNVSSTWTLYTCTFTTGTITGSGSTISTNIYINKTGSTAETFYIDAVQLQTGSSATAFGVGNTIQVNGTVNTAVLFQNSLNTTTAFQVQNAAGNSNVLDVDTLNSRVGIGTNTPGAELDIQAATTTAALNVNQTSSGNLLLLQHNGSAVLTVTNTGAATFSGSGTALTVTNTASIGTLGVTGAATIGTTLTLNGHLITGSAVPTSPTASGPAGGGAVCSISAGNDTSGTISVTTGTAPTAGIWCTLTVSFGTNPRPVVSGSNLASAALMPFMSASSTTFTFGIAGGTPSASTTYTFDYFNAQ